MANDILVIAEHRGGNLKKVTFEALGAAKTLAGQTGGQVHCAILGDGVRASADELAKFGAKITLMEHSKLKDYTYDGYCQALVPVIKGRDYTVILMGASPTGRDLSATLAARIRAAVGTDCTEISIANGLVTVTRPIYAGKIISKAELHTKPAIVTIRPNVFAPTSESDGGSVDTAACTIGDLGAIVREVVQKAAGRVELTEADIVVSGGRGIQDPKNYVLIENLAEVLGGAAGASRAIVDAGWVDHSHQVGQTGKTVSPKMYIAVGISGAIQHLAGMSSSKVIVAINSNPDAPIFKVADYGIVADALVAVPLLTEEFRKLLAAS